MVDVVTARDVTVKVALVVPAGIVTLVGAVAALVLLLDSVTTAPPEGAAAVNVAVPCALALPPTTVAGDSDRLDNVGVGDGGGVVVVPSTLNVRTTDHAPAVPAPLRARTRHQ